MYCIERLDHGGQWIQEICFKTEFKAFVNARTKSRATLKTYRVVHALSLIHISEPTRRS